VWIFFDVFIPQSDEDYQADGAGPMNTTLDVIKRRETVDRVQGDHLSVQVTRPTPRHPLLAVTHRHGELQECTFGTLAACSPTLQELRVSHYRHHFTDIVLEGLLNTWGPTLHTVSLRLCTQLTASSFVLLARQCVSLHTLEVVGSAKLTDEALGGVLSARGSTLRHLNIEKCSALTTESLVKIAACVQLEVLNLSCSSQLSDDCLAYIVKDCQQLRSLDLSGCHKLTTKCLHALSNLVSLRYLDIRYCDGIGAASAESKFIGKMRKNDKLELKN
jgi:hypothetical protein